MITTLITQTAKTLSLSFSLHIGRCPFPFVCISPYMCIQIHWHIVFIKLSCVIKNSKLRKQISLLHVNFKKVFKFRTLSGILLFRSVSTNDWMIKLHVTFRSRMGWAKICTRQLGQPIRSSCRGLRTPPREACLHISVRQLRTNFANK